METQSPPQKGSVAPQIFGPRLLWPNGCMDRDATWYGGRLRPTRHCVRCRIVGPATPRKKGTSTPTQFLAHVYCDQMAGWMKSFEDTAWYGSKPLARPQCTRRGSQFPQKGHISPPPHLFGRCPSQLLLSSCLSMI